jgi:hypothetical protein
VSAAGAEAEAEMEAEDAAGGPGVTSAAPAAGGVPRTAPQQGASAGAPPQRWRLPVPAALEAFGGGAAAAGGGSIAGRGSGGSSMHAQMLRLDRLAMPHHTAAADATAADGTAAADGAAAGGGNHGVAGNATSQGADSGPRLHARTQQVQTPGFQ